MAFFTWCRNVAAGPALTLRIVIALGLSRRRFTKRTLAGQTAKKCCGELEQFLRELGECSREAQIRSQVARAAVLAEYEPDRAMEATIQTVCIQTRSFLQPRYGTIPDAVCSAMVEANALRLRRICY